jgi:uncharacterized membrane protein
MENTSRRQVTLEALRSVPLFALLDDDAVTGLRDLLQFRAAVPGTVLFNYGEKGDAMYLIEDGKVSIHLRDADMNDVALAELAKGDFLGEMAILSSKPRSATATVSEKAELWVLKSSDFLTFIRRNPEVALEVARASTERLQRTDELLRQRVSRNINDEQAARLTTADRMADLFAEFAGSWKFIVGALTFFLFWLALNTWLLHDKGFDPFPYVLLNLILGIITGLQAPIIMMSQNRQSEKDRLRANLDYQLNLKNELALTEILRRVDVLETEHLPDLFEKQFVRLKSSSQNGLTS